MHGDAGTRVGAASPGRFSFVHWARLKLATSTITSPTIYHSPIRSCRIRCLPFTTVVQTTSAWTLAGARDLCVLAGWRKVQTLHPALLLDGWTWQLWCTIHGHPPENPFPGGHVVSSFKRSMNHRYGREFPINVTNGVSTTKWNWNKNSFRTVLKLFCFSFISLCGRSRIWNTLSDN